MTGRKRNIRDNFENSDLKMFPENQEKWFAFSSLTYVTTTNVLELYLRQLIEVVTETQLNTDISFLFYSKWDICNMTFTLQKWNYLAKSKHIRYDPLWFDARRTFL